MFFLVLHSPDQEVSQHDLMSTACAQLILLS
jgi:hypothetical protein